MNEDGAAFLRSPRSRSYFSGSGWFWTVRQFLSARLMFSASFLRHSVVQYFVWFR